MIQIGSWLFPTKKAAEAHIRAILDGHDHWQILRAESDRFVRALLDLHPRSVQIIDCGIAYIRVENRDGGRGFRIFRTDDPNGWGDDVSWRDCLYPPKQFTRVARICRGLIETQILEFRDAHFRGRCEVLGEKMDKCHVDHIPPDTFDALLTRWLQTVNRKADDIEIITSKDYGVYSRFVDPTLGPSWIQYHATHSRLRCVCSNCNLSVIRKVSPGKLARHGT